MIIVLFSHKHTHTNQMALSEKHHIKKQEQTVQLIWRLIIFNAILKITMSKTFNNKCHFNLFF